MATYFNEEARGPARATIKREEGKGGEKEGEGDGGGGSGSCGGATTTTTTTTMIAVGTRTASTKSTEDCRIAMALAGVPSWDVSAFATPARLHDAP